MPKFLTASAETSQIWLFCIYKFPFEVELQRCILVLMLWGTSSAWPVSEAYVTTHQNSLVDGSPWCYKLSTCGYKTAPELHVISFFAFRSHLFVAHGNEDKIMEKTSRKCFRKCAPLCPHFMAPVVCLGAEHVRSALKGAGWVHCDKFTVRKLCSRLAFSWDERQVSAPCGSDPLLPRQHRDSDRGARMSSQLRNLRMRFHFLNPCLLAWAICWVRKPILLRNRKLLVIDSMSESWWAMIILPPWACSFFHIFTKRWKGPGRSRIQHASFLFHIQIMRMWRDCASRDMWKCPL